MNNKPRLVGNSRRADRNVYTLANTVLGQSQSDIGRAYRHLPGTVPIPSHNGEIFNRKPQRLILISILNIDTTAASRCHIPRLDRRFKLHQVQIENSGCSNNGLAYNYRWQSVKFILKMY